MLPILLINERVVIDAMAPEVWKVLTDLPDYPHWNPFLPHAQGEVRTGAHIRFTMRPPHRRALRFNFKVTRVVPDQDLRMEYIPFTRGYLDREWDILVQSIGRTQTAVTQRMLFRGRFVPHYQSRLEPAVREGLQAMNRGLKEWVERRGGAVRELPKFS